MASTTDNFSSSKMRKPGVLYHQADGATSQAGKSIQEFIAHLHGPTTTTVALCHKQDDGKWVQELIPANELVKKALHRAGQRQSYIGLNPVRDDANRRTDDDLHAFNSFFIDLDTYEIDPNDFPEIAAALKEARQDAPEALVEAVLRHCKSKCIPEPSLIVFSGRGLQLIWLIEPIKIPGAGRERHQLFGTWAAIQEGLVTAFEPFKPDRQAMLAAQVIRLPETINTKSGYRARLMRTRRGRYVFLNFQKFADKAVLKHNLRAAGSAYTKRDRQRSVTPRMRVVRETRSEIEDFIRRKHPTGLIEGSRKRHSAVHTYTRACRYSFAPKTWEKYARQWAREHTDLQNDEIESIIASVAKSRKRFSRRIAARELGVTTDVADRYGYVRLRPTPLSADQRRVRGAELRRQRRRGQGVKPRLKSVLSKISEAAGVSLSTLFRRTTSDQRFEASQLWRDGHHDQALLVSVGLAPEVKPVRFDESEMSVLNGTFGSSLTDKEGHTPLTQAVTFTPLHDYLGISERSLRRRPVQLVTKARQVYRVANSLPYELRQALSRRKSGRPPGSPIQRLAARLGYRILFGAFGVYIEKIEGRWQQ